MPENLSGSQQAEFLIDSKRRSLQWMQDNYYDEFANVFKAYKCEKDPEKDANGKDDPTQSAIGMPDTWSHVRRSVARLTAQIPNIGFKCRDAALADRVGRTCMYQWDRGHSQRVQKKHVAQATLFGWSVRAWYWEDRRYDRTRRIDPLDPNITQGDLQGIANTYGVPPETLTAPNGEGEAIRAKLLADHGRGMYLPITYKYTAFTGPKCDFLFIGDCFPEPNFQSLQKSNWFCVQRRRNREWLVRVAKAYPDLKTGLQELLTKYPDGTPLQRSGDSELQNLRQKLTSAIDRSIDTQDYTNPGIVSKEWTITEMHQPGEQAMVSYLGEEDVWIGKIKSPYDLDGKIPFTELLLIDDLLAGIGDSNARIMRGLQFLHDRQVNVRSDLVDTLLRPLYGTSDRDLYEQPELLKRYSGMRLVYMRGPGELWSQGEQAATAAVAVGLQDESGIERQLQKCTGENNMSLSANLDPQQNRTATGARLQAYSQDVITKDGIDMVNLAVTEDAEMMYQLNRSELVEPVEFDAGPYDRNFKSQSAQDPSDQDLLKEQWMQAEPADFQVDGQIVVETGSTLADDDESKVGKAQTLFQVASSRPDLFNQLKARDEFLIAMGKGRELAQWAAPPSPPPPPPEVKPSLSVSAKWLELGPQVQMEVLKAANITVEPSAVMPPGPMGAPPGQPPGAVNLPPPPAEDVNPGLGAFMAAKGHAPPIEGIRP